MEDVNPVKELCFGAISGVIGRIIEYPFDTVKVRLQSTQPSLSTVQIIKSTYTNEGIIRGFYQGVKAPLVGSCFENAILFATYNTSLEYLHRQFGQPGSEPQLQYKCVSGGIAGFVASFLLTPVELVKCQLQVKNLVRDNRTRHLYSTVIGDVVKKDGVLGLWKGLGSTLLREINGTAIWFGTYEVVSEYLNKKNPGSSLNPLTSGAIAGITFNFAIFPIDTIKSNIQTNAVLSSTDTTYWKTMKKVGIRNLYNGLGITLIRSIPANAMIFYSYELLKNNF
ncbi:mitochondrial ornithine carrier protein [Yamadazyma tenuis]|uniref:Mitochondrial thiamine pyrophosphate carrier 1 n=1 Tax=Candida tenuis (strain ATCC 10573 / BCRC 21748 / CBS 615 / JCM 9827 / NBRC 10315 / NRRL Y-1498 / VKM Y-70) TaxID=590646 RepID=G3B9H1_CANTC|nr:mitochondrial carrier [Yamadazyma tenuis ATCC 10573]EGV61884.1 mitochondrial carrier [Yamadazyma tenuis ATCC 10573]WEJ93117.1 mitochondrial ornithine carrier protein [Yamadazyma tenuis]